MSVILSNSRFTIQVHQNIKMSLVEASDHVNWPSEVQSPEVIFSNFNIPDTEKIFFLGKYVGGTAKEALEGHFLLESEDSYSLVWNLLDERYGQPFVIAKAFRDKWYAWPCIASRDSVALRQYVDFLRSCECAMSLNKNLQALNDPVEKSKTCYQAAWMFKPEMEQKSYTLPTRAWKFSKFQLLCNILVHGG